MKKILVAGDIILDTYTYGTVDRISPEAPVIILKKNREENRLGGAANVALNLKMLGANIKLIGSIGKEKNARIVKKLLVSSQIDSYLIESKNIITIHKNRLVSDQQQIIRVDLEDKKSIQANERLFYQYFSRIYKETDIILFSDYDKGTLINIRDLIKLSKKQNKTIIIDPKGTNYEKYKFANILTPNLKEFETIVGTCGCEGEIVARGLKLIKNLSIDTLIITRGKNGLTLIKCDGTVQNFSALAKDVFDVTGAGDTFIANLALNLSKDKSLLKSIDAANFAAGKVVGKFGTSFITAEELEDKSVLNLNKTKLIEVVKNKKKDGKKVVFTNGCFDILHPGHIKLLTKAKKLGDILVVAVNSDKSIKELKGNGRPINRLKDRLELLRSMNMIDFIIEFSEKTPINLIKSIKPDILVKGNDYNINEVVGADFVQKYGGIVKLIELKQGYSTTNIIQQLKNK